MLQCAQAKVHPCHQTGSYDDDGYDYDDDGDHGDDGGDDDGDVVNIRCQSCIGVGQHWLDIILLIYDKNVTAFTC